MEKTLVFTHRLDLALRLVDTTSGRNVSGRSTAAFVDGKQVRFGEKGDQVLIFRNLEKRAFRLTITSPLYETAEVDVDLEKLDARLPLLEIHLVPGRNYIPGIELLSVEGTLPGIQELSAVRMGENSCLIREFDPRRRQATVFNPHHLALDRVHYALVDPDRGTCEPFRILRMVNDQTLKLDRVLEMSFRNYFPITPQVLGKTGADGSYCLRLRDDGTQARWLIRWVVDGEARFRTVDFRSTPHPRLEEGGD